MLLCHTPSRPLTLSFLLSSFSVLLLCASAAAANFSLRGDAIRFRRSEASSTRRAYIAADFCARSIRLRPITCSGTYEGQDTPRRRVGIDAGFTPALVGPPMCQHPEKRRHVVELLFRKDLALVLPCCRWESFVSTSPAERRRRRTRRSCLQATPPERGSVRAYFQKKMERSKRCFAAGAHAMRRLVVFTSSPGSRKRRLPRAVPPPALLALLIGLPPPAEAPPPRRLVFPRLLPPLLSKPPLRLRPLGSGDLPRAGGVPPPSLPQARPPPLLLLLGLLAAPLSPAAAAATLPLSRASSCSSWCRTRANVRSELATSSPP